MPLPVLPSSHAVSAADLLRFMGHLQINWSQHLAEEVTLDAGRLFVQPKLAGVSDANCVLEGRALSDEQAAEFIAEVDRRCAAAAVECRRWTLLPEAGQSNPLARRLEQKGFSRAPQTLMHLLGRSGMHPAAGGDFKIIPGRAAFRQVRALAVEEALEQGSAALDEATVLHLDDGHYDMLLALAGGEAAGFIGVLTHGEVGGVMQLFVAPRFRARGVATLLLDRALESCARGQTRHVLAAVDQSNENAERLFRRAGFGAVGTIERYRRM